jgi:phosphoribosyl-ATP pyrophosphohydrolase/phosphoribosyl-AMP cyclohydrolase/histidinol dehydrogenase
MTTPQQLLRRITPVEVHRASAPPVSRETLMGASEIVEAVRAEGAAAVRRCAERFSERSPADPLVVGRDAMDAALAALDPADRAVLERAAARIERFALAQRQAIRPVEIDIPGGRAGHTIEPVAAAGCYAPAGRYPLPSSVLMTAITARIAGCSRIVVASPGAHPIMLAAAAIAGADQFLAVGGAHAIAAMALGIDGLDRCDVVCGPGNAWVTAAKQLLSGEVGIDMLAGPSELLVLADDTADARLVAIDLLAQAEHDTDARAILITTSPRLADAIDGALESELATLPTRDTARAALRNGFVCLADSLDEAIALSDRIAPEHLEIMCADADAVARRIRNAGGVFIGAAAAEVLGDYGIGPNHTLPTGGTARFRAGLSVAQFLRLRTWIRIDDPAAASGVVADTVRLAEIEGLAGHARAAESRRRSGP